MNLLTFARVILRHWWLVLLAVLITAGSAWLTIRRVPPVYQAVARVVLQPSPRLTDPTLQINAQNALERRTLINTLAEIAQTSTMSGQVAATQGIPPAVVASADTSAIVVPDSNLIEIRVRSTDAALAAQIANGIAAELSRQVPQQTFQMTPIEGAVAPTVAVEPRPMQVVSIALLFGMALGVALALASDALLRWLSQRHARANGAALPATMSALDDPPRATDAPPQSISGGRDASGVTTQFERVQLEQGEGYAQS